MNVTLLDEVAHIARMAGQAIMAVYNGSDLGVTSKADDSPLTLADLAAHKVIVAGLEKLEVTYPILSEEAAGIEYAERSTWSRYWLVDPLDGTKEFIKRNGEFTVNIALIENGAPILGVVYAPVLDLCYFGSTAGGAYLQRGQEAAQPILAMAARPGEKVKVVASRSHADQRTHALLERLGEHECISMGSSLKLCLVAQGAAHFYPRLGPTMEWDTAAAHAVVRAAGGRVCTSDGKELQYNKANLLNPEFFVLANSDQRLIGYINQ
ncbi:MAG: 3'(2'),5'-bisphosphate nucleotidase CysQ [Gallionella sp.]|nr:3'(2'),5'-bisphosphate nucleotidase CysQ [Gallionella sp.]